MKKYELELPGGLTMRFDAVEEMLSMVDRLQQQRLADPAPEPIPALVKPEPPIVAPPPPVAMPGPVTTPTPAPDPAPVITARRRPTAVYLTEDEAQIVRLLRQHPDGMTTAAIAAIIGKEINATSQLIWRLRTERPFRDTSTPLVTKITNKRHRITPLGKSLKLLIADRPAYENRAHLHWDQED